MSTLLSTWYPPSPSNWALLVTAFQYFPLVTTFQWLTDWYPAGKTSTTSRLNLPGRYAWALMEVPGFLTVLYCMYNLPTSPYTLPLRLAIDPVNPPSRLPLPVGNWTMAGIYTLHYIYRALISPLVLNPSMSPIHIFTFLAAATWQIVNGLCIGGWLAGYGPKTVTDWSGRAYPIEVGLVVWGWGLLLNMFHDDELREIRRQALRRQEQESGAKEGGAKGRKGGVEKHYEIPHNYLFKYILYPHYLFEWVEWAGFWMVGGLGCVPARNFLINEIATMLPRALAGKRWYVQRFGKEKVGNRKAIIPGLL